MRKLLKVILSKSRVFRPVKMLHQQKIVVFNYHRIRQKNKTIPFDETVYGPDAERFHEEMKWIKRETRILSEEEMIDITYRQKPIKEMCSMVTFDDGYRDNFEVAYPILKKLKIPAMFFIPTGHISDKKVGWWDIVAYLLKNTKKKYFSFRNREFLITDPKLIIKNLVAELKTTDANEVDHYIENLSKALELPLPDTNLQSNELMTWDQIKILSDNGMNIGTHSHDHSILSRQDSVTLKAQLKKSIEILESVTQKKIHSIAYPIGGYDHFNDETKKVSKEIGLKLGFSFLTGVNHWGQVDPFDVKRMSVRPEWVNLDIPLAFPGIFLRNEFAKAPTPEIIDGRS